jgi:hypothetical protein
MAQCASLIAPYAATPLAESGRFEEMMMAAFRGSCLCGEAAFEVDGPFDLFLNCHCSRCRKASGTAHACAVIVKAAALRWLRGEASVARFDLPQARSFATAFCKICGSQRSFRPGPSMTRWVSHPIGMCIGRPAPIGTSTAKGCF